MAETRLDVNVTGSERLTDLKQNILGVTKAQISLESQIKRLDRELKKGTISIKQHSASVEILRADFRALEAGVANAGNNFARYNLAAYQSAQSTKRFASVGLQQVGYQVGDFAVQLQGGTNAAVAFGQQMSQLLGIFGPMGAIAGAGVAIGTAFVAPMLDAQKAAKDATEQIDNLKSAVDLFVSTSENIKNVGKEFGSFASAAESAYRAILGISEQNILNAVDNLINADIGSIANSVGLKVGEGIQESLSTLTFSNISEFLGADVLRTRERAKAVTEYADAVREFNNAESSGQRVEALQNLITIYSQITEKTGAQNKEFINQLQEAILALSEFGRQEQLNIFGDLPSPEELSNVEDWADNTAESAEKIRESYQKQVSLLSQILRFGEDSQQVEDMKAKLARDSAESKAKESGASGQLLAKIMELYDAQSHLTKEIENQKEEAKLVEQAFSAIGKTSFENTREQILAMAAALGITVAEAERLFSVFLQMGGKTSVGKERVTGEKDKKPVASGGNVVTGSPGSGLKEEDPFQVLNDYIEAQRRQIEVERTLLTLGEEAARIKEIEYDLIEKLGDGYEIVGAAAVSAAAQEIAAAEKVNELLNEKKEKYEQISNSIEGSMESAFMSIIDGTESVSEAFKKMASEIISEIVRISVIQPLVKNISSILGFTFSANGNAFGTNGIMPYAKGGVFGDIKKFADGGVINNPTLFNYSGGTGLMGEAGPEAIMPLKRNAQGELGVVAGNTGNVTVVQNFNVNANGDESVKRIVREQTPLMATAAKAAVLDAKRRGGSYGNKF